MLELLTSREDLSDSRESLDGAILMFARSGGCLSRPATRMVAPWSQAAPRITLEDLSPGSLEVAFDGVFELSKAPQPWRLVGATGAKGGQCAGQEAGGS
jgi:hypothetical protein